VVTDSRLAHALDAVSRGYRVFLLWPGSKKPIGRFAPHGFYGATTDPVVIRTWFRECPDASYGIVTGGRVLVLDVDGEDGERRVQELGVPRTLTVATPRGLHRYYTTPIRCESNTDLFGGNSHVDVKADRAYVVGPGSSRKDGQLYAIIDDIDPVEAPAWLLEMVGSPGIPSQPQPPTAPAPMGRPRPADAKARTPHRPTRRTTIAAVERDVQSLLRDVSDGRNARTFDVVRRLHLQSFGDP
jgi:hypothetical protein